MARSELERDFARRLRANPTDAERALWALLRGAAPGQPRFRRQQPIGPYIADFFCPAAKLVIELDGDQHGSDKNLAHDSVRTAWLVKRGYCVLRFDNGTVLKDRQGTLDVVWRVVASRLPLPEPAMPVRPSLKGRVD